MTVQSYWKNNFSVKKISISRDFHQIYLSLERPSEGG